MLIAVSEIPNSFWSTLVRYYHPPLTPVSLWTCGLLTLGDITFYDDFDRIMDTATRITPMAAMTLIMTMITLHMDDGCETLDECQVDRKSFI